MTDPADGGGAVELARPEDLAAIAPLFGRFHRLLEGFGGRDLLAADGFERWAQGYARSRDVSRAIFVRWQAGRPAGFAEGVLRFAPPPQPLRRLGYVSQFYVEEDRRGAGLGGELFAALAGWFEARGAAEIVLDVEAGNERAAAFWRSRGFRPHYTTFGRETGR